MGFPGKFQLEDMAFAAASPAIAWEKFRNATVLVSGASGLIGSAIVNALLFASERNGLDIRVVAWVRNAEKAAARLLPSPGLSIVQGPVETPPDVRGPVDYVVHAASPTQSLFFVRSPVETLQTAVMGMRAALEFAKNAKCRGLAFLSTMEVYGHPPKGLPVRENQPGAFDPSVVRNCYPLGKLLCESMGAAYASEYGVPAKSIRLTQTFGPGVERGDPRVFAEFARCVLDRKDIVLHSDGLTERCYLYVADAVTAVLSVLTEGKPGESYTAANRSTYCSIRDMARMVATDIAGGAISVRLQPDAVDRGYADTLYLDLDTSKLESLGWSPKTGLREMFSRMIGDMQCR